MCRGHTGRLAVTEVGVSQCSGALCAEGAFAVWLEGALGSSVQGAPWHDVAEMGISHGDRGTVQWMSWKDS